MTDDMEDVVLDDGESREEEEQPSLTNAQAQQFDMLRPMIEVAYKDMAEFSKKRQEGIVNELKVRYINRLLSPIKEIMANDESASYLELLNEEELPENSDAVFVLGQFRAAMDQFKKRNTYSVDYVSKWRTIENLAQEGDYEEDEDYEEDDE
jgi:hypothetical protein